MVDFIIVGLGLAGLSFAEELEKQQKSFVVFENQSQKSSRVAGGLCNPVILKRFTLAWEANEQLQTALTFYKNLDNKLDKEFVTDLTVYRRFASVEEQNLWFEACDKPLLKELLSPKLERNINSYIEAPFHYGKVNQTYRIDIGTLLNTYEAYLERNGRLKRGGFYYQNLKTDSDFVEYNEIKAKHIIFAEGFGVKANPFFRDLPLRGNKGEYILIKSEKLKLDVAVKSSFFIIPLGDDLYKVGATYDNVDKSPTTTENAKEKLLAKLVEVLKCDFEVVDQMAGIRPSTKDRRPFLGTHYKHKNLHIFNGLGSRGIMMAPSLAPQLYHWINSEIELPPVVDIKRFYK